MNNKTQVMKVNQPGGSADIHVLWTEINAWPFFMLSGKAGLAARTRLVILLITLMAACPAAAQSLYDDSGALYVVPGTVVRDMGKEVRPQVQKQRQMMARRNVHRTQQAVRPTTRTIANTPDPKMIRPALGAAPDKAVWAGHGSRIMAAMLPAQDTNFRSAPLLTGSFHTGFSIEDFYKKDTIFHLKASYSHRIDLDASSCRPPPFIIC